MGTMDELLPASQNTVRDIYLGNVGVALFYGVIQMNGLGMFFLIGLVLGMAAIMSVYGFYTGNISAALINMGTVAWLLYVMKRIST